MNLKNLYNSFAQHPEGNWIMQPRNAQLLYQFVKQYPIKKVLDLGTGIGCSASIIALALKEKGETDFHIDSVEQSDKCIKLANELIPEELLKYITIHKSNVVVWQTEKIPYVNLSVFDKLPEEDYDLILNDGPGPFMQDDHFIDLPNGTIHQLLLEDKLKSGTYVVFDGRILSLRSLERYFGDNFYLHPGVDPRGELNIIERKNNPVQFKDGLVASMIPMGYFK